MNQATKIHSHEAVRRNEESRNESVGARVRTSFHGRVCNVTGFSCDRFAIRNARVEIHLRLVLHPSQVSDIVLASEDLAVYPSSQLDLKAKSRGQLKRLSKFVVCRMLQPLEEGPRVSSSILHRS